MSLIWLRWVCQFCNFSLDTHGQSGQPVSETPTQTRQEKRTNLFCKISSWFAPKCVRWIFLTHLINIYIPSHTDKTMSIESNSFFLFPTLSFLMISTKIENDFLYMCFLPKSVLSFILCEICLAESLCKALPPLHSI